MDARRRILIIDDDEIVRSLLRALLEQQGFLIDEAQDGRQGVRRHREQPADLVFCDIFMEGQEGLATIRALRTEFPGTPIVAMSGGSRTLGTSFLDEALLFGAAAALSKPFNPAQLRETVARLLG